MIMYAFLAEAGRMLATRRLAAGLPIKETSLQIFSSLRPAGELQDTAPHSLCSIGGGGIRTPETVAGLTVFKTVPFNHSGTPPLAESAGLGHPSVA